ncbi:MAG TPA: lysylphosphatidylglycerol synthase domain-containing protein [Gemmatimonadales bacterium]|nr:lysylphosphatidylglycerol synthase domain-containing protein [Gemmatimonadales bacterium]
MRLPFSHHLVALLLVVADVVIRGARIRLMLPVPLWRAMAINTCGDALAALTPARLGGEPIRFVGFQRSGASAAQILAAFATEIWVDGVLLLASAALLAVGFASAGRDWFARLVVLARAPATWWITAAVLLAAAVSAWAAVRYRRHWPAALLHPLRDARRLMRTMPPLVVVGVMGLTLASMAARTAVLPVLASGVPGTSLGGLITGSFALVYGQVILPTPAGAGAVELGFIAGFAGALRGGEVARLLVVWRFYTLALGVLAGAAVLARWGWLRRATVTLPASPAPTPSLPS